MQKVTLVECLKNKEIFDLGGVVGVLMPCQCLIDVDFM